MRPQASSFSLNRVIHHEGGQALLLMALFALLWLRLALPAINFGQMSLHAMHVGGAMATMSQPMEEATAASTPDLPTDRRCREAMPGCDVYLQGLCSLAPGFVLATCEALIAPATAQAAPPIVTARDLSPLRNTPKQPPRW